MNRKIKFRAWDKVNGGMIPWNRLLNGYNLQNVFMRPEMCGLILMQYTGLKDKNGVEIYEGDILQSEHYFRYQVVFKGSCWRCEPLKNKGFKNRFIGRDLKVIGNIYQNNDLLEVE